MSDFAYSLSGDRLPALPDDAPTVGLPPPVFTPQQQFGMNGGPRPGYGIPRFFVKAVKNANGGYDNVEYVEILTPGDKNATPVKKVSDGVRARYRDYYDHWKRTQQMAPVGVPIEMWPEMTPALVYQLKSINVFTVEQLANIADTNLGNIPFGKTLKLKAIEWLAAKDKADVIAQATAQTQAMQDGMRMMETRFEAEKAEMRAENADLKSKLDAILARLSTPEPAPVAGDDVDVSDKPRRGRPPKAEAA